MNQKEMAVAVEKMQTYVALAEQEIAMRKKQFVLMQDELSRARLEMRSLQDKLRDTEAIVVRQRELKRVSVFQMPKIESGGKMEVCMVIGGDCQRGGCCDKERLYLANGDYEEVNREVHSLALPANVFLQEASGTHGKYSVSLSKCEPWPSPNRRERVVPEFAVCPAQTMCDIWRGWTEMEQRYKKRERRIAQKRRIRAKLAVHEAFGTNSIPEDSTLFWAVCGFMEGSVEGYDDNRWFVAEYIKRLQTKENEDRSTITRATKCVRKELLTQMVSYVYNGEIAKELEKNVLRKKRFSTVKLARVSDMNSSFNPSALGAIACCEGGKAKGEVGLLCGETTLRRCMDQVFHLAEKLGFYSLPLEHAGNIWCWGDESGPLRTAVNRYIKTMYYDNRCDSVTKEDPWIIPLTGDLVVTPKRGAHITVLGPKLADRRLVQQELTGKTMNQSSGMYTPAVAGFVDEAELMPYFHRLVDEFLQIERQQYCVVNDQKYTVYLHIIVIADLSFLHKYTRRGGGSHASTCFCMFCGAFRNFKHLGYPGGCLDCRARGAVYGADGIQICPHYDACTEEFLAWQKERYCELSKLVPEFPLSSLPPWANVAQLRDECLKRCVGPLAGFRARIGKTSGKDKMTARELSDWIFRATRDDATLSNSKETGVMYCPMRVVEASLKSRKVNIRPGTDPLMVRLKLRDILKLEQEYSRMTMHMQDERFGANHASANAITMERLVLCLLHLPMRTHEKVLTLLLQHACQNRTPTKSTPILDEMVLIIRRLAKLKGSTWTYVWNKASTCVEKVKLHWDQSKHIFQDTNMGDLSTLVRLAIVDPIAQAHWVLFLEQYIKLIGLLTVSRDYTDADIVLLEQYQDLTYKLLVAHCGGIDAITNYFHYLGVGHVLWMCRRYGNIWRYRNEGAEAYNKNLSKRYNMFNSCGNRGNILGRGNVLPFEVLGKWMGRYAMWQLDLANDLFIAKGGTLGKQEICYDVESEIWEYMPDVKDDTDDDPYTCDEIVVSDDDSDSDLEPFTPEDDELCVYVGEDKTRYSMRDRPLCVPEEVGV